MLLVYCELCGLRIPQEDVAAKTAIEVETNRWHCPKCIAAKPAAAPPKIPGADAVSGTTRPMSDSKRRVTPVNDTAVLPVDAKRRSTPAGGVAEVSAGAASSKTSSDAKAPDKKPLPVMVMAGGAVVVVVVVAIVMALGGNSPVTQEKNIASVSQVEKGDNPSAGTGNKTAKPEALSIAEMEALAQAARKNVTDPAAPPSESPQTYTNEFEQMRVRYSQKLLDEATAFAAQQPDDVKGLRKRYDDILRSYRSTPAGEEAAKRVAELPQETPTAPLDESVFANGISMLPQLDLEADKVSGEWSREGSDIKIKTGRFEVPYDPGGEYDIRFIFTQLGEGGGFGLVLRKNNGKQFLLVLGLDKGEKIGLSKVRGKPASENATTTRLSSGVKINQRHTVVARIQSKRLCIFLDGVCKLNYDADFNDLSLDDARALKSNKTLGLFTDGSQLLVHALDIYETNGKGRLTRGASKPVAEAVKEAVPVATTEKREPAQKKANEVSFAALKSPASAYEQLATSVYALAANGGLDPARSKLDAAKKDKTFSVQAAQLDGDSKILAALESLEAKATKGAEMLTDRRPFKFERSDGKSTLVGKGTRLNVKGVQNGKIILEEKVGGASAESQLDMQVLSPATRLDLAQMGIGSDPDGLTSYAAGLFVAMHATRSSTTEEMVESKVEFAAKNKGQPALLDHLRARLKAREREKSVEKELAGIKTLLAEKKNNEARAAVEAFTSSAAGSATGERAIPDLQKVVDELKARETLPGLWASYYSGDDKNRFQSRLTSKVITKLNQSYGNGGPLPNGPRDNFGVVGRGLLRIEASGTYEFEASADDGIGVWVGSKNIVGGGGPPKGSLTLDKGDHPFSFRYHEGVGGAQFKIRWKPPSANAFEEIPESVLLHEIGKKEEYEKD